MRPDDVIDQIRSLCHNLNFEFELRMAETGRMIISTRLSPNTTFCLGVGGGLPLEYRIKSGAETDADEYFKETSDYFLRAWVNWMRDNAKYDGEYDGRESISIYKDFWFGSGFWDDYEITRRAVRQRSQSRTVSSKRSR